MKNAFIEGECMNCGKPIWYRWGKKKKHFFLPEYLNRPLETMNEIEPICPKCGIELDNEEVIAKAIVHAEETQ